MYSKNLLQHAQIGQIKAREHTSKKKGMWAQNLDLNQVAHFNSF